ncbi:MAG: DUF6188 family protein [Planctomycetota bacterium]
MEPLGNDPIQRQPIEARAFAATFLDNLVGRHLSTVSYDRETDAWNFAFGEDRHLRTESPWRLLSGDRILLGWRDHGQRFGLPEPVDAPETSMRLINGAPIVTAVVLPSGDLRLGFEGSMTREVLADSSGYESWTFRGSGDEGLVCMGQGRLCCLQDTIRKP